MSKKFAAAFEIDCEHRTPMAMGEKTCLPLTLKKIKLAALFNAGENVNAFKYAIAAAK